MRHDTDPVNHTWPVTQGIVLRGIEESVIPYIERGGSYLCYLELCLLLKKLEYQQGVFSAKPSCIAAYRIFMIKIIGEGSWTVKNANHW